MSRRTTLLVIVSILVLTDAGVALGKGPQSVTLTGPGIDSPIELLEPVNQPISCDGSCPSDPMSRLMEQTGIWYGVGDLPVAIHQPEGELGKQYVLTWSRGASPGGDIHQFIYLDGQDGPVIHTPPQKGLEGWGTGVVGWFRASDGLSITLASLGVVSPDAGVGGSAAMGARERLGLVAASGAAILLLMWAYGRPSFSTEPERP